MTAAQTYWFCLGIPPKVPPCGESGRGDKGAEKHTKATMHATTSSASEAGAVAVLNECRVTVFNRPGVRANQQHACGEPVVRYGLCQQHAEDKERLS
jgi:hypothetical protein